MAQAGLKSVFDWTSVNNLVGIVSVGLDELVGHETAGAVGNFMFADLTSVVGSPRRSRA